MGVAGALMFLQRSGLVHRDVRAANIALQEDETPKLMHCLPVRSILRMKPVNQQNSDIIQDLRRPYGSLLWMAPEAVNARIRNEPCPLASALDVYSFGLLVWEVLAQRDPDYTEHQPAWTEKFYLCLKRGVRPPIDEVKWPASLVYVMKACWVTDVAERADIESVQEWMEQAEADTSGL
jgi:serine/threonine protein kinase